MYFIVLFQFHPGVYLNVGIVRVERTSSTETYIGVTSSKNSNIKWKSISTKYSGTNETRHSNNLCFNYQVPVSFRLLYSNCCMFDAAIKGPEQRLRIGGLTYPEFLKRVCRAKSVYSQTRIKETQRTQRKEFLLSTVILSVVLST